MKGIHLQCEFPDISLALVNRKKINICFQTYMDVSVFFFCTGDFFCFEESHAFDPCLLRQFEL